jgi:septum formation protein
VLENARRKVAAGLEAAPPGSVVLGVDTEVVLDGRVLGKAPDPSAARARLRMLSGRTHAVLSAVVLVARSGEAEGTVERAGVSRSEVTFRQLDRDTVESYLHSGEWRDRAGAYAIQGLGSTLIERVEGDFSNVVGLPVRLLFELAPELRDPAGASAREA